ncbi:MAG: CsgG/HfaB family protein [bacterium]
MIYNMFRMRVALATVVLAGGCVSSTITEDVRDKGPQVTVAPLPVSDRMTIGIGRFSYESVYGSGLFSTDASGDQIGKQASDLLTRHLIATQRFKVVERPDIGRLSAEASLMGKSEAEFKRDLAGLDALILGSVTELGRETIGGTWLIGKKKTQRARARVTLRLVDPKTGEAFFAQEGSGDATITASATLGFGGTSGFDSTLEGKAIDAAIVNLLNNVIASLDARRSSLQ